MVYGAWRLFRPDENRGFLAVAGCLLPGIILCFVSWLDYGTLVLPCALCALVIAKLLPGHLTITNVCLTILGLAILMAGADMLYAQSLGYGLESYSQAIIDEIRNQTEAQLSGTGTSVTAMASLDQMFEIIRLAWPFGYLMQAAIVVAFGCLGLALSQRLKYAQCYASFTRYDVPLWAVVLLIIGVICVALPATENELSTVLRMVGVNSLLVCRVLFFFQGLAALLGIMDRRKFSGFTRVLILVLALFAEVWFFAICVFGLIDVWANFRKLGRSHVQTNPDTQQD